MFGVINKSHFGILAVRISKVSSLALLSMAMMISLCAFERFIGRQAAMRSPFFNSAVNVACCSGVSTSLISFDPGPP